MAKFFNTFLLQVVVIIWIFGILNWLMDGYFNQFGLFPRQLQSLPGILMSPLLHGGFSHLLNNTVGFISLGWLVSLYNQKNNDLLFKLTFFIVFCGGLLTWLFGRPSIHIGLSGVIFGYWGFITVNGFFERSFKSIFLSLGAILFYGGMIFGLLPVSSSVSFEGHFFGALSGVAYSYLYRKKRKK